MFLKTALELKCKSLYRYVFVLVYAEMRTFIVTLLLYKIPQKLAITACLIEGESSGGRQILKTYELFLSSKRKLGLVGLQIACILYFV